MKRRDFICGLSCVAAGFAISEIKHNTEITKQVKCKNPTAEEYLPTNDIFKEVYIETTSHCNLSCKGCDAYSPLAKPEFVTFKDYSKDFNKIKDLFPKRNIDILYLGGEPLLNPDLVKIIKFHNKLFPESKQSIMTNGILLTKMDEDFWKTLRKFDVKLRISNHPIDIDRDSATKLAKKYGLRLCNNVVKTDKLYDLNTLKISKNNIDVFKDVDITKETFHIGNNEGFFHKEHGMIGFIDWGKNIIDLSGSQDYVEKKYNCKHRGYGQSYTRGNLYYCYVHAHINHFAEYFNVKIPITKEDYIKISDVKDGKEIDEFVNKPKPLCRFCKQCHSTCFGGKPHEWEFSKKEISEWT